MHIDLSTVLLAGVGIALAVLIAVMAGTLAARLFFHASGLGPGSTATESEDPRR